MRLRIFDLAFLLITAAMGPIQGDADGMKELLARVVEEKITDPYSKQLFMSKYSEMRDCLLDMASMTPEVAVQVVNQMVPQLNDCGAKLASEPDDKKPAVYVTCTQDAAAEVKANNGMNDEDGKIFVDGMECLKKSLGF
ncbi:uncharacterized protein [Dermacentor andersoni]|uniref:uncharacterized protein n=1 Tax=Dermacentor andersoni TaxID=34620 RepID=UPI0021554E93|nr:uncharacterized protein LOC126527731 [Dermacentor andersoni]